MFFIKNKNWQRRLLSKGFEDFAIQFENQLLSYPITSGNIVQKNGKSSKTYINLAESLLLIKQNKGTYEPMDEFVAYSRALQQTPKESDSIFTLSGFLLIG